MIHQLRLCYTYIEFEVLELMGGLADPEEGLTLADINQAVAPLTLLPALASGHYARKLAHCVTLKQVLDLKHQADLLARLTIGEVMSNYVWMLKSDTNWQYFLLRKHLSATAALRTTILLALV